WFISLAELGDPLAITGAIVKALGVPRTPRQDALEQIVAFFSQSGAPLPARVDDRSYLLILDNVEQLAAGGAFVVQTLLDRIPRVRCLIPPRRKLGLPSERVLPIAPLALPEADFDLQEMASTSSVQLLVDRAQRVRPDFQVTRANASAIVELCRK